MSISLADHRNFPTAALNAFKTAVWSANRRETIHRDWALVLINLVERCRIPGRDRCSISVTEIRLRTRVQRNEIIAATRWAEDQGLIERYSPRVKKWCQKLTRFIEVQATTVYRFRLPSEYGRATASLDHTKKQNGLGKKVAKAVRKGRRRMQETVLVVAARLVHFRAKLPGNYAVVEAAVRDVGSAPGLDLAGSLAGWPQTHSPVLQASSVPIEPLPRLAGPVAAPMASPAPVRPVDPWLAAIRASRGR